MRSPTFALIWEQWRQVRLVFLLCVAAMAVVTVLPERYLFDADTKTAMQMMVFIIATLFILVTLLMMHSTREQVSLILPRRMLTLPLHRTKIALIQFLFRVLFFVASSSVFLLIAYPVSSDAMWVLPTLVALTGSLISIVLAVAWIAGRRSVTSGVIAVVTLTAPLLYLLIRAAESLQYLSHQLYPGVDWTFRRTSFEVGFGFYRQFDDIRVSIYVASGACILLCAAACVAAAQRFHRTTGRTLMQHAPAAYQNLDTVRVSSARSAFAFELRHKGIWYPLFCFGLLSMFAMTLSPGPYNFWARATDWLYEAAGMLCLAGYIAGLFILVYDNRRFSHEITMQTRPLTTASLVTARAGMSLTSIAITLIVYTSIMAITNGMWNVDSPAEIIKMHGFGRQWWEFFAFAALLPVIAMTVFVLMWSPLQFTMFGGWLILTSLVLSFLNPNVQYSPDTGVLEFILFGCVPLVAYVIHTASVVVRLLQRHILTRGLAKSSAALLIASAAAVLLAALPYAPDFSTMSMQEVALMGMTLLCGISAPTYALLAQALWLDRIRHGEPALGIPDIISARTAKVA